MAYSFSHDDNVQCGWDINKTIKPSFDKNTTTSNSIDQFLKYYVLLLLLKYSSNLVH